jgi:hypothetical protein
VEDFNNLMNILCDEGVGEPYIYLLPQQHSDQVFLVYQELVAAISDRRAPRFESFDPDLVYAALSDSVLTKHFDAWFTVIDAILEGMEEDAILTPIPPFYTGIRGVSRCFVFSTGRKARPYCVAVAGSYIVYKDVDVCRQT